MKGEKTDRLPVSFWRHFYDKESTAQGLADAMLAFQKKYDWDFMKVNPRASYHIEGWGAKTHYPEDSLSGAKVIEHPVKKTRDWEKIKKLTMSNRAFAEQLEALRLIKGKLKDELFIVETIFSPLSVVGDLVKEEQDLVNDLREKPELIHKALEVICEVFSSFADECLNSGADGIFFATTEWATKNTLTEDEYLEFGKPYDLKLLRQVESAELNILHICKSNNFLPLFADYPVKAVNWNSTDSTNLNLKEGAQILNKAVLGGIDHKNLMLKGTKDEVSSKVKELMELSKDIRLIVGPGCIIPPETPEENLQAVKEALEVFR